jgi:COP9 signalosome complex subunit 5
MVTHARSGGSIEVMGNMLGSVQGDTFVITDAFRLPVEGTETRVNAHEEAYEYQVNYLERLRDAGRTEIPVGWYHSHPGYGCWLSGIDVQTQAMQQEYQEPSVAIVIDPERTMSGGHVEIGAFRTYPEASALNAPGGIKAAAKSTARAAAAKGGSDTIVPEEKAGDFGAHADKYYPLEVSYFKPTLDTRLLTGLQGRYWVQGVASNPLAADSEFATRQTADLAAKLRAEGGGGSGRAGGAEQHHLHQPHPLRDQVLSPRKGGQGVAGAAAGAEVVDPVLGKVVKMSERIEMRARFGMVAGALKERVFVPRAEEAVGADEAMKDGDEL